MLECPLFFPGLSQVISLALPVSKSNRTEFTFLPSLSNHFFKILLFTMKNTSGVQKVIYSTRTILIVIGIVLLVYLIGHLLIVSILIGSCNHYHVIKAGSKVVDYLVQVDLVLTRLKSSESVNLSPRPLSRLM